jgi:trimeric autotransporter adhesin
MRRIIVLFYLSFFIFNLSFFIHSNAQIITTVAGNGVVGSSGDGGPATAAEFNLPYGICVDRAGDIIMSDWNNHRVREIAVGTGLITTIGGTGGIGFSGDGGAATAAQIHSPYDLALDTAGNIYINDEVDYRIRKITLSSGIINTIIGTGIAGFSGDGGQATNAEITGVKFGLAVDDTGNIYFSDVTNNRIRKVNTNGIINTIIGNGVSGYSGDGGQASSAEISAPGGLKLDASGNIYFCDANNVIRKVSSGTNIITTIAGNSVSGYSGDGGQATSAEFNQPTSLCLDNSGNIFIIDANNNVVREVSQSSGIINTYAGNGIAGFSGDGGPAILGEFDRPVDITNTPSGGMVVTDDFNYRIRELSPDTTTQPCYSWKQKASLTAHGGRGFDVAFSIGHYGFIGTGNVPGGNTNDFWRWNQNSR